MSVKDLLFATGSSTSIEIYDIDSLLWEGTVNEINFLDDVPYGDYEVSTIGVSEGILQIHI